MSGSVSVWDVAWPALKATATTIIMVLGGVMLRHRGIIDEAISKGLSKVVMELFVPCLVLSKMTATVSLERVLLYWPVLVAGVLWPVFGLTLGYIMSRIFVHGNAEMRRPLMMACGFGNHLTLPLAILQGLSSIAPELMDGPTDTPAGIQARGLSYMLFFMVAGTPMRWAVGNFLLAPRKTPPRQGLRDPHSGSEVVPLAGLASTEERLLENDTIEDPKDEKEGVGQEGTHMALPLLESDTTEVEVPSPNRIHWEEVRAQVSDCFWQTMSPPVWASLFAVVIGIIPPIKALFIPVPPAQSSVLDIVYNSWQTLGQGTVPTMLVILGDNMANGPMPLSQSTLPPMIVVVVAVTRLILLPAVVTLLVYPCYRSGLLPADPTYLFVLLLQAATPPAINIILLSTMHGWKKKEMATILFYSYMACMVTVTLNIMLFLWLLRV